MMLHGSMLASATILLFLLTRGGGAVWLDDLIRHRVQPRRT
jgi:hypothetical protein